MNIQKIKNYWDMEIIGNRRKKKLFYKTFQNFLFIFKLNHLTTYTKNSNCRLESLLQVIKQNMMMSTIFLFSKVC